MDDDTTDPPNGRNWTLDSPDLLAMLGRFAAKLCPPWFDQVLREEVQQEALLRLTNLGDRASGERRRFVCSFLWQTVYYVRNEVARREGRRRERERALGEAGADHQDDDQGTEPQYRRARLAEIGKSIRCCLRQLRIERRIAVILHLMGFSNQAIAQCLHCNKKSAENKVYRGLDQLQDLLVDEGVEL